MCGPLVMMLGRHRYRSFYFLGRTLSFALAGLAAGEAGAVLQYILHQYQIPAATSLFFGGVILLIGLSSLFGFTMPGFQLLGKYLAPLNRSLSLLMLRDQAWPAFLFGFFTIALPCGQTLIVFSACALVGSAWTGFWNGAAFALLTSPSLWMAMRAHHLIHRFKPHYNIIMGVCALCIGTLALCRGLADLNLIPHLILNPNNQPHYHIALY